MALPKQLVKKSKSAGEKNDCAVKAVALAANEDYTVVHDLMTKLGRRSGRGTPIPVILGALKALGCHVGERKPCRARTVRYLPGLLPKGRWLVLTSRHILCVKDGEVLDWTEGRRHRPIAMWEVSL